MDPLLIVFGLGVGVLVGATGMGGGSLMTPLLILVFGVKPVTAVGTDLAYAAVTKTVGGFKHFRQGTVDLRLSTWMALGSVPAAIAGVFVLEALQRSTDGDFDSILVAAVAGALLFTGVAVLARVLFLPNMANGEKDSAEVTRRNKVAAALVGVFVGFVLGVTSAGSGALIAVALIMLFRLVPTRVVGTDVFHAAILLWAAAIAHLAVGNIDFALAGTILLGSLPGVWIGSHASVRMPTGVLRTALGIVLIASGLALTTKAGLDLPPAVLVGVPVLLSAIVWLVESGRRPSGSVRLPAPERA